MAIGFMNLKAMGIGDSGLGAPHMSMNAARQAVGILLSRRFPQLLDQSRGLLKRNVAWLEEFFPSNIGKSASRQQSRELTAKQFRVGSCPAL